MNQMVMLAAYSLLLTVLFVVVMLKFRDQDPELEETGMICGLLNAGMFCFASFWI